METLRRLTGRFVGLGGPVNTSVKAPHESALTCLSIFDTSTAALGGRAAYSGRGFGIEGKDTLLAALGETFERYSLLELDSARTSRASVAELLRRGVAHVSPAELLSFDPAAAGEARQGRLSPIPAPDQPMLWLSGIDLHRGAETLLPVRYCVMADHLRAAGTTAEGAWYHATSSGAATAASPVEACLGGLFELLERDAFMLMWYHRLRFPDLVVPPASRLARRLAVAIGRARLEYRLIDLTEVHEIPVVVAVVRGVVREDRQYGVGAGAAATRQEAGWRAMKEALAYYTLQWRHLSRGATAPPDPNDVRNFPDHMSYFLDQRNQGALEFLFECRPALPAATPGGCDPSRPPPEQLRELTSRLHGRGIDLYAVDLTPVEGPALGVVTYKLVSPQLVPLDWDHRSRHLSSPRLLNEPTARGWRDDQPTIEDLNHDPHPFP